MYVVTVNFEIEPGEIDAFVARVRKQATDSVSLEPECHRFEVALSTTEPGQVLLYELYTDEEAFAVHLDSDHFKSFRSDVEGMVRSQALRFWTLAD